MPWTITALVTRKCLVSAGIALLVGAEPVYAQRATRTADPKAFILETLGGSAGSLVGMGIVAFRSNCDVEDLRCLLLTVGAGGALGALGATIGTSLTARAMNSPRSTPGAALGAIAGTGVGLGVHWLLNNSSDRNLGDKIVVPIFVISQGLFATLGSRVFGASR
jgi:hypothetical protein